jgi:hypothetical protein
MPAQRNGFVTIGFKIRSAYSLLTGNEKYVQE